MLEQVCAAAHVPIIEDAAQSFGATYQGRRSGALSGIGCTSFFPSKPLGCCIESVDLKGGSVSQMNHKVDHILTDDPKSVKLVSSAVTGRQKHNGWWDSDHAGIASVLEIRR